MSKAKEFRDQSIEELKNRYHDSCKELFVLRNRPKGQKNSAKPHQIKLLRKDIARLLTVISEVEHKS